jgi:hypothetical protein
MTCRTKQGDVSLILVTYRPKRFDSARFVPLRRHFPQRLKPGVRGRYGPAESRALPKTFWPHGAGFPWQRRLPPLQRTQRWGTPRFGSGRRTSSAGLAGMPWLRGECRDPSLGVLGFAEDSAALVATHRGTTFGESSLSASCPRLLTRFRDGIARLLRETAYGAGP